MIVKCHPFGKIPGLARLILVQSNTGYTELSEHTPILYQPIPVKLPIMLVMNDSNGGQHLSKPYKI